MSGENKLEKKKRTRTIIHDGTDGAYDAMLSAAAVVHAPLTSVMVGAAWLDDEGVAGFFAVTTGAWVFFSITGAGVADI